MTLSQNMVDELKEIELREGDLTVDSVLAKAKDSSSALHNYSGFNWNMEEAAEQHWRYVTRKLIQVYVEVVQEPDGNSIEVRGWASVVDETGERVYRRTARVLKEDRARLILQICDRCESAIKSYSVNELEPILQAIAEVRATLSSAELV